MKRKIALLLATVMTLSMLPMNLFAASSNHFSKTPTTIPENTLLYEEDFDGLTRDTNTGVITGIALGTRTSGATLHKVKTFEDDSAIDYALEGSNFVITPSDVIRAGDTFRVKLENAEWFFRSTVDAATDSNTDLLTTVKKFNKTSGSGLYYETYGRKAPFKTIEANSDADYFDADDVTTAERLALQGFDKVTGKYAITDYNTYNSTYDPSHGFWIPEERDSTAGTYYRTDSVNDPLPTISDQSGQIPYSLTVSRIDPKIATIVIAGKPGFAYKQNNTNAKGTIDIVIPLVTRATAEDDIKLTIQSSLTGVSSGTYIYGIAGGGATKTRVHEPQTAREEFEIKKLIIDETRLRSMDGNGTVEIKAPNGFTWADVDTAKVYVDTGLEWGHSGGSNLGVRFDRDVDDDGDNENKYGDVDDVVHFLHYGTLAATKPDFDYNKSTRLSLTGTGNADKDSSNYNIEYRAAAQADYALGYDFTESRSHSSRYTDENHDDYGHYDVDESTIVLTVADMIPSTKVPGAIYIEGLTILAEEDAPMGVFNVSIKQDADDELGVTKQDNVKAGERVDYGVTLKTTSDATTLVSGRYEEYNSEYFDDYQQTASVKLAETTYNSWWAGRTTTLTLPEKVRFAQVEVTDGGELAQAGELEDGVAAFDGTYRNDGKKYGHVMVDNNVMTFTNLKVNAGEKGSMELDVWVSIAADFSGDIKLAAGGSAMSTEKAPSVVIAKAIAPVTIETKVSDIKVGYQYQPTAEIKITETKAGNLLKGKRFNLSVTDLVSTDMSFSPSTKVSTEGDLKIKNINTAGSGSWGTTLAGTSNAISFDIDKPSSTKAGTIVISDVSVKIDRSIPVSNDRPYDVVAWGNAVAQNFDSTSAARKDEFSVPGISADYIRVVSSAGDNTDILSQEVRVTVGERNYTVNGKVYEMDAASYISTKSNSTMVPLRFVANAFGLKENQIIWDDATDTVTLNAPNKVVQFMVGSQMMNVQGAAITMLSPDGLAVSAENVADHVYVPFRALGNAFGVSVDWENGNTAVYNKGAAVANTTTPATTPAAK